jgi:hypothetical protein
MSAYNPLLANTKTDQVALLRAIHALVQLLPDEVNVYLLRECARTAKTNPDWTEGMAWSLDQTRHWREISGPVVALPKNLDNAY